MKDTNDPGTFCLVEHIDWQRQRDEAQAEIAKREAARKAAANAVRALSKALVALVNESANPASLAEQVASARDIGALGAMLEKAIAEHASLKG